MICVSTKNKSEKILFYFTFLFLYTGSLTTKHQCMEKYSSFHLTYHTIFYSFWFLIYNGKPETTLLRCCLSLSCITLLSVNILKQFLHQNDPWDFGFLIKKWLFYPLALGYISKVKGSAWNGLTQAYLDLCDGSKSRIQIQI